MISLDLDSMYIQFRIKVKRPLFLIHGSATESRLFYDHYASLSNVRLSRSQTYMPR